MKRIYTLVSVITLVILLTLGVLLTFTRLTHANGDALWGPQADLPTVHVISDDYVPTQEEKYNCHDHDFVIRVSNDNLHPFYPSFADQTYTRCAFYTSFGIVAQTADNFMQLNGSLQPYKTYSSLSVGVVPNERSLFVGYGSGLAAYDNPQDDFIVGTGADFGDLRTTFPYLYHLKSNVQPRILKDTNGNVIKELSHSAPSANAKWFVIERYNQLLRARASDFNLLTFPGGPVRYDGQPQNDSLAITNDGRYVLAAGNDRPSFKLYDLSTCQADPSYNLNNATGCGEVDLLSYLQQQVKLPIVQINFPHFSHNGTQLSLVVMVYDNGVKKNEKVILTAPGSTYNQPDPSASNYIALGDSFASGEGAHDYYSGTDESDNKCHLSEKSYPYLLGFQLQLDSFHSVACSGAVMNNVNGTVPGASQYSVIPADAFSDQWIPGYLPQIQFIDSNQPDIVTISVVGNDIGFSSIIAQCIVPGNTCYQSYEDRKGLAINIDDKFNQLVAMYSQIRADTASDGRVYVIGYPQIVQADGTCAVNVHLDQKETEFAAALIDYLDSVIKRAAAEAGVNYVDTENAFKGYQLCSGNPSAVNGLGLGNGKLHIVASESYHPTAFGHQLLADTIAAQTDGFKELDPEPDWSITPPNPDDASDFVIGDTTGQQPVREIEFDQSVSNQTILKGGRVQSTLSSSDFHLDPGANYQIVLHSTPVELGTAIADAAGNLSYSFVIPDNIETGWHTIDVYGDDITGQPVDIQGLIYVAASSDDWNGDGIPNDQEPCGLFPASGIDMDQDGIDDACDSQVTKPPAPAAPTVSAPSVINAADENDVVIDGSGESGTTAHISIDDSDPGTPAVTATTELPASDSKTEGYSKALDVTSLDDGQLSVRVSLSNDFGTSPAATASITKDTHPPIILATQQPMANLAGWNNQAVNLQLDASDSGSGVSDIAYDTSGAQVTAQQSVRANSTTLTISGDGTTVVTYTATDKAGNTSVSQSKAIRIDTVPPTTSIDRSFHRVLHGIFGEMLTGTAADGTSGAATTEVAFVSQEHQVPTTLQASCVSGCGTSQVTWRADTTNLPSGLYLVSARSMDAAGNSGSSSPAFKLAIVNFPWLWSTSSPIDAIKL